MTDQMITCEDVWKVYGPAYVPGTEPGKGQVLALKGASFSIRRGECFVIMGLSGSGKSTLVRCLTRLVAPSSGRITIDGHDVTAASPGELTDIRRRVMGMVFQNFALLPHLTVLENVAFPLAVRGVPAESRLRTAHDLLKLVGLSGRERSFPNQLSGGQQQRVGIARALSSDPEVLFMDEPFSALDPLLRRELQNEFIRLRQDLKKTIVFITHDFDEAIRLADRIAIMRGGEILEIGTPEQLVVHSRHPYVSEFTRHCDRSAVLRTSSLMRSAPEGFSPVTTVAAEALIADVAGRILASAGRVGVVAGDRVVGEISREDVIAALTGRPITMAGAA